MTLNHILPSILFPPHNTKESSASFKHISVQSFTCFGFYHCHSWSVTLLSHQKHFLFVFFCSFFLFAGVCFSCITFDPSGPPYRLPPTGWFGHLTWLSIARLPRSWWVLLYNFLVTSWLSQPLVVGCWMQNKCNVITRQPHFFTVLKSFPSSLQPFYLFFYNSVTNKWIEKDLCSVCLFHRNLFHTFSI